MYFFIIHSMIVW